MIINSNITAQVSADNLQASQTMLSKSLSRLSSGSKIISPSDDAAGLAVASRLDAQVQRIGAAQDNVGNAVSFTQTQDGYLKTISGALDRMSELSILAQDVTKSNSDRSLYQSEFSQLSSYVSTAATKDFNGVSLFSTTALNVTVDGEGSTFSMSGIDLTATAYTNALSSDISTTAGAQAALTVVKDAITKLSQDRATIGAYQSRLNSTADQLTVSKENLTAASSSIQDVDVAEESTEYAKENILVQSGTAMLAQANTMPQSVLRLLQQ
ncbi:MAG TPA: flagellin [Verrucomicrobiae bacterium]|nr:flagellin [Verrucomicrobiae bacterium]